MFRRLLITLPLAAVMAVLCPAADKPSEEGFESILDAKSLKGWHVSAESGHSRTSKNKTGGKWEVVDGVLTGSQDVPGNGGIVLTDKKYGNFEVVLEMRNDDGPDSGLFLRCDDKGKCYQAMIDYHKGGNLMGIYGEGIGGKPHVRNFDFGKDVTEIFPAKKNTEGALPLPVKPEDWKKFWNPAEWNELRARIEGNPPKVTTWIKGVKFSEFQDTEKRLPDSGFIGLQVHGGGDYTKQFVRYRNIRVKELK